MAVSAQSLSLEYGGLYTAKLRSLERCELSCFELNYRVWKSEIRSVLHCPDSDCSLKPQPEPDQKQGLAVVLDVDGPTKPMTDPRGKLHMGASATTKINRTDFGMNGYQGMAGNDVTITIDVGLVKPAGNAPK